MSDIFSLNGCYLDDDIVSACGQVKLGIMKNLLSGDNINKNKITKDPTTGSYGIIDGNKQSVRNALSVLQAKAVKEEADLKEKNTKRNLQINTYYAKKTEAQSYVLRVIYIMVIVVVIMWAVQTYTTYIPEWIISTGMALTIGICSIIIIFKSLDITNRSTFDYDQPISSMKNLPPIDEQGALYSSSDQQMKSSGYGKSCQNGECCPKFFSFNPSLGYCSFNPFTPV
jgi:hypothetical protein